MAKLDRENFEQSKSAIESLLPDPFARKKFVHFLARALSFADNIKSENWNLNLDQDQSFLRFSVGQCYCIDLEKKRLLITCDRTTVEPIVKKYNIPVVYQGYERKVDYVRDSDISKVPDLLAKVPNSIGILLEPKDIGYFIDHFEQSNRDFITEAIETSVTGTMRRAYSSGALN